MRRLQGPLSTFAERVFPPHSGIKVCWPIAASWQDGGGSTCGRSGKTASAQVAIGCFSTYMQKAGSYFGGWMMDRQNFERRRVLQAFTLGSIAVAAAALGGCAAAGTGARPPRKWQGGGSSSGKSGNGGGPGAGGRGGN